MLQIIKLLNISLSCILEKVNEKNLRMDFFRDCLHFLKNYSFYFEVSVCVCARAPQRRVLHPLELELEAVTSSLMWLLKTEHGSFARVACTLNSWASSPALLELFLRGSNTDATETSPHTGILSKALSKKPEGLRIIYILSAIIGKLHQNHHEIPWEFDMCCYWSPRR